MSEIKDFIKERLSNSSASIDEIIEEFTKEANEIADELSNKEKIEDNYEFASEALIENAKLKTKEEYHTLIEELLSPDSLDLLISVLIEIINEDGLKVLDPFNVLGDINVKIKPHKCEKKNCNCKKPNSKTVDDIISDYINKYLN